jgi:hypothetical protein
VVVVGLGKEIVESVGLDEGGVDGDISAELETMGAAVGKELVGVVVGLGEGEADEDTGVDVGTPPAAAVGEELVEVVAGLGEGEADGDILVVVDLETPAGEELEVVVVGLGEGEADGDTGVDVGTPLAGIGDTCTVWEMHRTC